MTGFGIACAAFCACPLKFRQRPGTSPRCRWFWAFWDCAVLCAPGGCVLCQLGRLYFIQRRRPAVVTSTLNSTSGLRASDFAVSGVSNFQAGAIWLAATVSRPKTTNLEDGRRVGNTKFPLEWNRVSTRTIAHHSWLNTRGHCFGRKADPTAGMSPPSHRTS